jgi:hypothetical protein
MAETNVQVFSGTVTATNLIRGVAEEAVRWNSQSETVFPQSATTRYYKIATLGATGEFANGGKLRISGTIGGFGGDSTTLIDAFVTSRGAAIKFGGTLSGYGGDPTGVGDIVVYLESNGTFGVWLKLLRYYTFDFIISGAQVSNNTRTLAVLPCPTTDTSVATPTGTLQGSVVDACSVVFTDDGNVGIGTNNPVGQLQVYGVGQATTTSFNQSGDLGGILTVKTSNGSAGDGGGIMFGANQGYFAAIKGTLSDGGDNTSGELRFCTRNPPSSSTMQVNMVMNRAGYVGIGTTDPYAPLEVHGADLTGQPVGTTGIISRHVAGFDGVLNIFGVAMSNGEETVGLQTQIDGRAWATDIAAGWNYGGDSRYNLILQPYKGNVGIGTTDPVAKFNIQGTSEGAPPTSGGEGTSNGIFRLRDNFNVALDIGTLGASPWTTWLQVADTTTMSTGYPLSLNPNGGNVGIGTNNPDAKLEVVQGGSIKLSGSYDHSTAKLYIDRDGPASWGNTGLYDAYRYFETRNSSGVEHFNSVKIGPSGIAIGYDPPVYTRSAVEGIICSKRVAIGRNTATYTLDVNGDIRMNNNLRGQGQSYLYLDNNNEPKLYSAASTQFLFATNGYAYAVLWNSTSDRRLKKNIKPLSNAIDTIKKLNPVHYDKRYTNNDVCDEECTVEKCYNEEDGFIAQEIQEIPELAHAVSKPESNDMLGLNYNSILTYCVKAVQEQQEIIETEKAKVAELLSRVTALENKETSNVA